ncbi:hypothetical protein BGW38_004613 [Lunasporangiospora selenospora]|uniref:Heparan-alpha-glucosaminide N-acetyltransferase catalytic domain-containing protein n=1 Tax=Lunasporangiospora selenospora TaxID=979761 RepID=A0A9P6KBW7_9FUNG|nr:hypothetical protein BGW38_004613 [Lunasporangiospora selenospora]
MSNPSGPTQEAVQPLDQVQALRDDKAEVLEHVHVVDATQTHDSTTTADPETGAPASGFKRRLQLPSNRLLSLDLLRGLAILLMITSNSQMGDSPFPILTHPAWIGFTISDSIFPAFLFISGVAIPLAIRIPQPGDVGYNRATIHKVYIQQALRVFKRGLIIMCLGYLLALYGVVQRKVNISFFRWPGVLQRIGFCYGIVAWMHILVLWRGRRPDPPLSVSYVFPKNKLQHAQEEIDAEIEVKAKQAAQEEDKDLWPWFILWLICTYAVQVEGCPRRGMVEDPKCSAQAYFDLRIFGTKHTYNNADFDPEGALSTLTSILNVWFGWYIGCTVRSFNAQVKQVTQDFKARKAASAEGTLTLQEQILEQESIVRIYTSLLGDWFWYGLLWWFIGWLFSLGLPLIKSSWTATFAVFTSGLSQTMLAILFYKFDAHPKIKYLHHLHLEHQKQYPQYQMSRHFKQDLERRGASLAVQHYSGLLNLWFQIDQFCRHWFRRSIVVVLGSMGRNAILLYMCAEAVTGTCFLIPGGPADPVTGKAPSLFGTAYEKTWGALDIGGWGSLFFALGFAALHVLLAIFLDYKKWYFKV